jgi:hypothetical protein
MIPRELWDMIISPILSAERPAPISISEIEEHDRVSDGNNVCNRDPQEPAAYASNASSLLLTSKQICTDTLDFIKRTLVPLCYKLDIKFLHEHFLVPTWTSNPVQSGRVHHLGVKIQSLGTYERDINKLALNIRGAHNDIWTRGSGGRCGYVWTFYSMLTRFLELGPRPVGHIHPDRVKSTTVDCLELDFVDLEDTTYLPP